MAKILFDIDNREPAATMHQEHLVMEVGSHIFSYALVDGDRNIGKLRFYELDARNATDLAEELRLVIAGDPMLHEKTGRKTLIYNFPESQLVPAPYFNSAAGTDLMNLLCGDLHHGITLSERIQGTQQYNVFRVPAAVHSLLQRSFTNSKYWHYYSVWLQSMQAGAPGKTDCLELVFYPNRVLVSAVKDGGLQLLQSFSYEAAEDVSYYLLNICAQLHLSPQTTPAFLSGMIDASSVLYSGIEKYFGSTVLEPLSAEGNGLPASEDYPPHFFHPLAKLALCVS